MEDANPYLEYLETREDCELFSLDAQIENFWLLRGSHGEHFGYDICLRGHTSVEVCGLISNRFAPPIS
jgi:hypothetical protein